ncbi:MAG: helix-turn-helix domain-containing protein [Acholeplasmatales bacterium]
MFLGDKYVDYSILIKSLRDKMLVSQQELAKLLDVSFATVNRWEKNRTTPSIKAKRKLSPLFIKYNIKVEEKKNESK